MSTRDNYMQEIRNYYGMIYGWHHKIGHKMFKTKFEIELLKDVQSYRRYFNLLEKLPPPHKADIEIISYVAHEVLSGCMEWSFWEEVKPGLPLNHIAKHILIMLKEIGNNQKRLNQNDTLKKLKNISTKNFVKPDYIEIDFPDDNMNIDIYREYALLAYSDVIHDFKVNNLGGQVALGDTNLEHEHARFNHDIKHPTIKFRNSKAMHFEEEKGENSLNSLAKFGVVSILSVKIGV